MIYPIGLGPRADRELLERLAAESGGVAFFPEDVSSLRGDYGRVVEDLRRRYVVEHFRGIRLAEHSFFARRD